MKKRELFQLMREIKSMERQPADQVDQTRLNVVLSQLTKATQSRTQFTKYRKVKQDTIAKK